MPDNNLAPVVFVDTETTGLHPDRHEIWEVALIDRDDREHSWLLPVNMTDADPIALNIGRFHDRHPQGNNWRLTQHAVSEVLTTPDSFARLFTRLTHGCHLVGAVISFDEERLRRLLWAYGMQPSWHYHLVDVEALAAGWLARRRDVGDCYGDVFRPPWDSGELSRSVGVNPDDFDRHTALGDARWAKAIYQKVMGQ